MKIALNSYIVMFLSVLAAFSALAESNLKIGSSAKHEMRVATEQRVPAQAQPAGIDARAQLSREFESEKVPSIAHMPKETKVTIRQAGKLRKIAPELQDSADDGSRAQLGAVEIESKDRIFGVNKRLAVRKGR